MLSFFYSSDKYSLKNLISFFLSFLLEDDTKAQNSKMTAAGSDSASLASDFRSLSLLS